MTRLNKAITRQDCTLQDCFKTKLSQGKLVIRQDKTCAHPHPYPYPYPYPYHPYPYPYPYPYDYNEKARHAKTRRGRQYSTEKIR